MPYRWYIFFVLIVFLGSGAAFAAEEGYYPLLLVDGKVVMAQEFNRQYAASLSYYEKYLANGSPADDAARVRIAESVLTGMVESDLIDAEVRRQTGADLPNLIDDRISGFEKDSGLAAAASSLYGLSFGDFRNEVLVPQAEKDILSGELFLKGQNLQDWLAAKKKSAQVVIFSPLYRWDGETAATR